MRMRFENPKWEEIPDLKVDWFIGNTSNLNVGYLPKSFQDGSLPFPDSAAIKSFSDKLFATQRGKNTKTDIKFVGGEFTLHPEFEDIAQYLKINGSRITLNSNGTKDLQFWNNVKYYLNAVNLNYHHSYVDQNHFLNVTDILYENLALNIEMHVTPTNFDEVEEYQSILMQKFPYANPTKKLQFFDVNRNPLNYSEDQKNRLRQQHKEFVLYKDNGETEELTRNEVLLDRNYFEGWWCYSGVTQIVIDSAGNIFNGWCLAKKIGNIKDNELTLCDEPIKCNRERCYNGFDIMAKKIRSE